MGWCGGTQVMQDLIVCLAQQDVDDARRRNIYEAMLASLTGMDWDGADECCGLDEQYDAALDEMENGA